MREKFDIFVTTERREIERRRADNFKLFEEGKMETLKKEEGKKDKRGKKTLKRIYTDMFKQLKVGWRF